MTPDDALAALRARTPLVHCITNYVAMSIAANTLLAAGASPAMVHAEAEAPGFAGAADALTINIGTLSPPWAAAMTAAAAAANSAGKPWVLDPVAHFASPWRGEVTRELLALKPTILRGNASEIRGLGPDATAARGPDATDPVAAAEATARHLAGLTGGVVVVTGETDFVTDAAGRATRIAGGSPLMARVTAMGCALTALTGAFAAIAPPAEAAIAALTLYAEAGERAAARAEGPGSFAWRFLDALAAIAPGDLAGADRVVAA